MSPRHLTSITFPLLLVITLLTSCRSESPNEANPQLPSQGTWRIQPIDYMAVTLDDEFWQPKLETNRQVTIPHIMQQNIETGRIANFRRAAGLEEGRFEGYRFNDTDVYKTIEAASYALGQQSDPELAAQIDELIALIAAAQEDDGYLFPARTADPDHPADGVGEKRWIHVHGNSHELYGAGHLIEAAVAHHRATGKRTLIDVAIRFADLIDKEFGPEAIRDVPGHEEIELALVKLFDVTGEQRYLELAAFFLEERGQPHDGEDYPTDHELARYDHPMYRQDHAPVRDQREAVGHSVRAMYLYTGMSDVAGRTNMPGYTEALEALWTDVVSSKMYLTGGIGAQGSLESFGEAYELPNETAYAETCAAIGQEMWNHRLFLASGDGRYLDVMERILYNGVLSGVAVDGDTFFYTNPLQSSGNYQRQAYYEVACCPANLARLLGQLPGFIYGKQDDAVFVNLFIGSKLEIEQAGSILRLTQETRYPWEGAVRVLVEPAAPIRFKLHIRIPGWARNLPVPSDLYRYVETSTQPVILKVNGEPVQIELKAGFAVLDRIWNAGDIIDLELPMFPRGVETHPDVAENIGKVAIQRGPLVYAIEAVDHGGQVLDLLLPEDAHFTTEFQPETLGGIVVVHGTVLREGAAIPLLAVPYFSWANRGNGEMAVWLPTSN